MENKKMAVDYLIEILWAPCQGIPYNIIEQAKQMEREQIMDAYEAGDENGTSSQCGYGSINSEQYYNETYKQQDNG